MFAGACAVLALTGCSSSQKTTGNNVPSLKEIFKNDFLIGTALSWPQIQGRDPIAATLVPQQFNAATPENLMKAEELRPSWGEYNFAQADALIEYGKKTRSLLTLIPLSGIARCPPSRAAYKVPTP
ncbi:endo-1,4-beta-xylanase [Niabella sp. W65]|nr:endo-1,4-beta-xylanase [Niabella sp. W65]MCH7363388.1 endo-1,4-beta-xylanase [Niabella sp. W65]